MKLGQSTIFRVTGSSACCAIVSAIAIAVSQPLMATACKAGQTLEWQLQLSAAGRLTTRRSLPPTDAQIRDGEWVTYIAHSGLHVPDGFSHTIVIDAKTRRAWIYEIGGFIHSSAWYGPFPVEPASEGCTRDPELRSMAPFRRG